jgi:chromosome segregation and condensation protein ScpB
VRKLPYERQRQVLRFAEALVQAEPKGVTWKELARFAGCIPKDQLRQMAEAIEEGCERIDVDGW